MAALKPSDIAAARYWFSCSEPGGYTVHGEGSVDVVPNLISGSHPNHAQMGSFPLNYFRTDVDVVGGVGLFSTVDATSNMGSTGWSDTNDTEQHVLIVFMRPVALGTGGANVFYGAYEDGSPSGKYFIGNAKSCYPAALESEFSGGASGAKVINRPLTIGVGEAVIAVDSMLNGVCRTRVFSLADGSLLTEGQLDDAGVVPPFRFRSLMFMFKEDPAGETLAVGEMVAFSALTDTELDGLVEHFVATYSGGPVPYPGRHTVTNLDNVLDPNCIYFEQGVKIGDTFSFKETTEINGWGVRYRRRRLPDYRQRRRGGH